MNYHPPKVVVTTSWHGVELFAAGDLELMARPRVSIVGSRHASGPGLRRAARLSRELVAAGVVIVSGLARGIDRVVHHAALAVGGRTIGVIGTPLERCYPAEHAELQETIYREHLLLTPFAVGTPVRVGNFPLRTRLMARLSDATVIVEASEASGSLVQAREAMRLGRPLFILRSTVETMAWPAGFINKGAIVLDDVQQVLAVYRRTA